jgi:uncharacterized damage-inducible protein DinB
MTANELLIHLTRSQITETFAAARQLPPDRLNWQPAPGARSALDQLQELATALDFNWSAYSERKVEWSQEKAERWKAHREQFTDIDELERMAVAGTERLAAFLATFDPADYTAPVSFPIPGEFNLADCLAYHYWNATYHHGQIVYIESLLGSHDKEALASQT